jgi:hypothetical protein
LKLGVPFSDWWLTKISYVTLNRKYDC